MFGTQARQSTVIQTAMMDIYQAIKPPEKNLSLKLDSLIKLLVTSEMGQQRLRSSKLIAKQNSTWHT